ncbi:MAG: hypothetical protein ACMXX6_00925 [Candidatus Woesearchaeota archaeon]
MKINKQKMLTIFFTGIIILITAILINLIANYLNIITWYEYIQNIVDLGFVEASKNSGLSLIFLYLIYPFLLGYAAYTGLKLEFNFI